LLAFLFLVSLRPADMDDQPGLGSFQVGDDQADELGPAERRSETKQQQCAITLAYEGVRQGSSR